MQPTVDCKPWGGNDIVLHFNMGKNSTFVVTDQNEVTIYTDYKQVHGEDDDDRKIERWEFILITEASKLTLRKETSSDKPMQTLALDSIAGENKAFVMFVSDKGEFNDLLNAIFAACEYAGFQVNRKPFTAYKPPLMQSSFKVRNGFKTVIRR